MSFFKTDPERQAWLELPGGQLFFLPERTTIGRLPGNELVLPDDALSRQHAVITVGPAGYVLTDMKSRNGTYLGGKLLAHPATLRDGDRFRLGTAELRFRCMRRLYLPETAAGDGLTTQTLPRFEARECWLAVVTVEGYGAIAKATGGEKSLERLQTWISGVRPLLEQHFAQISYYAGDTIVAYWPCDSTKPSDVLGSVRAFEAWRARSPLPFRLVVHQGTSLVSTSTNGEELGGRDVSFVVRMGKVAKALGADAMLSAMAARTLGVESRCESCGRSAVEGMADLFTFYRPPASLIARVALAANEPEAAEPTSDSDKAVFLSYASEDAAAARRICEALRAAAVEVWLDQSELRGGDAWDHKIRRQIKACALFVPVISMNTQARREGYFRIEWKLAAQRTHAIADGVPFLLPVVIDATSEPAALVPAEFREVQWTRLNRADDAAAFAQRVRDLLVPPSSGDSGETRPPMPGWNAP